MRCQGKFGGDGVVQWGPSEGKVDRDPYVLLDVPLSDPILQDKSLHIKENTDSGPRGAAVEAAGAGQEEGRG